ADPKALAQAAGGLTSASGSCTGMAVHGNDLVLALPDGRLAVLDAASAVLRRSIPVTDPKALAFGPDGSLWAIIGPSLHRVDLERGTTTPVALSGLGRPVALAVEADGTRAIADA